LQVRRGHNPHRGHLTWVVSGLIQLVLILRRRQVTKKNSFITLTPDVARSNLKFSCQDWVFAAKWISESDVLILTAHNRVIKISIDESGTKLTMTGAFPDCEEQCILYSGQIVDDSNEKSQAAVLAGTVFRELIIW
jgi:hypothetical protein